MTRCSACLDPAPSGWHFCLKCHAWSDLYHGVVDCNDFHYERARAYFDKRRTRGGVETLVHALMRRVAELELAVEMMQ